MPVRFFLQQLQEDSHASTEPDHLGMEIFSLRFLFCHKKERLNGSLFCLYYIYCSSNIKYPFRKAQRLKYFLTAWGQILIDLWKKV